MGNNMMAVVVMAVVVLLVTLEYGPDLAFTVNYLSHFLLVEKLFNSLANADSGDGKKGGRIVQLTSTYHWKVDGAELKPRSDGTGPLAYESNPEKQSGKHVERSYANTKLAQIWRARSINKRQQQQQQQQLQDGSCGGGGRIQAACACPTWAATGIAGEDARTFLERMAFPVLNGGAGVTSANAILRSEEELSSVLLSNKDQDDTSGGRSISKKNYIVKK